MSGLAPLLAGRRAAGVYRWRTTLDDVELAEVAAVAGWSLRVVDGLVAQSKSEFLAAVGRSLEFPGTYGQNFDALADLLDDLPTPTVLLWEEWGTLARVEPRTFAALLGIFTERSADLDRPGFVVLLRGEGPDGT